MALCFGFYCRLRRLGTNDDFGFRIAEPRRRCDKADMTARAANGADRGRASLAWAMLLSLLVAFVTAHARPSGLSLQPELASLAAVQGVEHTAILTSAGKSLRAPDLRQAGDPDDVAFACAAPLPALKGISASELCTPDAPSFADENSRPEPRAPPLT
jgi:hypothetical protein